ncbi:hypothetical protein Rhe02_55670 [Rhizocola hellebori]|uniref:Uncharacterized protein n=1 Tax=Rhizocola hellebori TaxID=1392758 RepID=A0A8J3QBF5_9ACTN|nr:hypothetical protein [Rhizocola hellebori]GIH07500.1 hypothetical protein Rhe02_55670 [Rhizocola hellebori]
MTILSAEALLAKRDSTTTTGFPEEVVPIPGLGEVRVRGLSRFEAMHVQGLPNAIAREIETVSLAMVEPAMTTAQVKEWMKTGGAGEFEPVSQKIQKLSGMDKGAAKQAYRDFEVDPGSEFRVLPGAEAVDDGGAVTDPAE